MEIKVITHQVRDNLFIVSSDLKRILESNKELSVHLHRVMNPTQGFTEIIEDKMLEGMTVMVPDREYFDNKISSAMEEVQMFADSYLMD